MYRHCGRHCWPTFLANRGGQPNNLSIYLIDLILPTTSRCKLSAPDTKTCSSRCLGPPQLLGTLGWPVGRSYPRPTGHDQRPIETSRRAQSTERPGIAASRFASSRRLRPRCFPVRGHRSVAGGSAWSAGRYRYQRNPVAERTSKIGQAIAYNRLPGDVDAPVPPCHVRPRRHCGDGQIHKIASGIDPQQTSIDPFQNSIVRHQQFPCWPLLASETRAGVSLFRNQHRCARTGAVVVAAAPSPRLPW